MAGEGEGGFSGVSAQDVSTMHQWPRKAVFDAFLPC